MSSPHMIGGGHSSSPAPVVVAPLSHLSSNDDETREQEEWATSVSFPLDAVEHDVR